jgi:hypothetical protein
MLTLRQKRYIVLINWASGPVIDTDEISVFAKDEVEARSLAVEAWRRGEWGDCTIEEVAVFTPARLRNAHP